MSEGQYISLGYFEKDDVEVIMDYLRKKETVSAIGLWGRSMGAATALMHADRDPTIAGMVLDSAFSSLKILAEDLCKNYTKMPKFLLSGGLSVIRKTIKSKANFDINFLTPINHVKQGFVPAFFVAAEGDDFIEPKHTKLLHKEYSGDKNIIIVEGDHNSVRPDFFLNSVGIFFYNTLQCKSLSNQITEEPFYEDSFFPKASKGHKIGNGDKVFKNLDNIGGKNYDEKDKEEEESEGEGEGDFLKYFENNYDDDAHFDEILQQTFAKIFRRRRTKEKRRKGRKRRSY